MSGLKSRRKQPLTVSLSLSLSLSRSLSTTWQCYVHNHNISKFAPRRELIHPNIETTNQCEYSRLLLKLRECKILIEAIPLHALRLTLRAIILDEEKKKSRSPLHIFVHCFFEQNKKKKEEKLPDAESTKKWATRANIIRTKIESLEEG